MTSRRSALGALAAPFVASPLRAQRAAGFPNRPLRLVVTYPPGGVPDIVGRICAEAMGPKLGQPVIVENRAGAGGNVGVQAAAAAEPDGHTLLLGNIGRPGGGILALRGHASIQGSTDVPTLFNLLPVPPFDGSHVLEGLLPRALAARYERLRNLGFALVILLVVVLPMVAPGANVVARLVMPPARWLAGRFFAVADALA